MLYIYLEGNYWQMVLDIIALAVVLIAAIVGTCRGFFASLLSLLGFVGTFVLAYFFSDQVLALFDHLFGLTSLVQSVFGASVGQVVAVIVAFIITYLLIRLLIFILNHTVGKLFKGKVFGGVNRFMGFVLGLGKGVMYVALAMVAINIASFIPQVKEWSSTTMQQTYVVGHVYNWVGLQLGNYLSDNNQENQKEQTEN